MSIALRGFITGSSTTAVTSFAVAYTGWTTANPAVGDIIVIAGVALSASNTVTQTAGTGSWTILSSDSNTNMTSFAAYRVYASGDTAPTFGFTSAEYAYVMFALTPDASNTIAYDTKSAVLITTGTSLTPNSAVAAGSGEASVILSAFARTSHGTSSPGTYTPPTGWTTIGALNITGSLSTYGFEVAAAQEIPVSGTVTPGAETITTNSYANVYHLLIKESAAAAAVIPDVAMAQMTGA